MCIVQFKSDTFYWLIPRIFVQSSLDWKSLRRVIPRPGVRNRSFVLLCVLLVWLLIVLFNNISKDSPFCLELWKVLRHLLWEKELLANTFPHTCLLFKGFMKLLKDECVSLVTFIWVKNFENQTSWILHIY